jgi:transposase-like protein
MRRPRARSLDGTELHLDSYGAFSDDDQLKDVVMERMLAGLATRRHRRANAPVGASVEEAASATSPSAVSRRFVARTRTALSELMTRDLSPLAIVALMIDGVVFAERCCVVALGICADGAKVPLGLFLGDTENKKVVRALLADLVKRGLKADSGLLVVIDGAKALDRAARAVFGPAALIQRCTVHKRRGVASHLPKDEQKWVDRRLAQAFNHPDPAIGFHLAEDLARQLETRWPDAAASVREGLYDMFTIRRLHVSDRLARSLLLHQRRRVDDLGPSLHHPQHKTVAGRRDDKALGSCRHAECRAQLPPGEGMHRHGDTRSWPCPPRGERHA